MGKNQCRYPCIYVEFNVEINVEINVENDVFNVNTLPGKTPLLAARSETSPNLAPVIVFQVAVLSPHRKVHSEDQGNCAGMCGQYVFSPKMRDLCLAGSVHQTS